MIWDWEKDCALKDLSGDGERCRGRKEEESERERERKASATVKPSAKDRRSVGWAVPPPPSIDLLLFEPNSPRPQKSEAETSEEGNIRRIESDAASALRSVVHRLRC